MVKGSSPSYLAPHPSHASPTTPGFFRFWDSTMLGTLKECPKRFEYQHILGYQPKGLSIHLEFGRLFHAGLERFYHAMAEGRTHDEACLRMVRWSLENSGAHKHLTIDTRDGDEVVQSFCQNCGRVNDRLGLRELAQDNGECPSSDGEWHPWTPDPLDPYATTKNRVTLIRSLVWYVEDHRNSPFRTVTLANGKPAVELSFRFHAFDVEGEPITLCGHMDRLTSLPDGRVWVHDHKTTKGALDASYFRQFTPHNQFTLYTIAGRVALAEPCVGVLVGGVQVGVTFTRSALHQVPRPKDVLEEWLEDAKYWITQARNFAITGHYPQNDKSCFLCPFKSVCAVSPSHRLAWLKADFQSWSWNPLEIRGDV